MANGYPPLMGIENNTRQYGVTQKKPKLSIVNSSIVNLKKLIAF